MRHYRLSFTSNLARAVEDESIGLDAVATARWPPLRTQSRPIATTSASRRTSAPVATDSAPYGDVVAYTSMFAARSALVSMKSRHGLTLLAPMDPAS